MDFEILPPTDDWIFKLLFGDERNKSILIDLLKAFVELPGRIRTELSGYPPET
jgi:hypothetical protein